MRSRTGGMGSAGGEGEVHSPSSMKVSATMPSKGARRVVWRSWARARATAEAARSTVARAARHAASRGARLAVDAVDLVRGHDSLRGEAARPVALALGALGGEAGLVALGERGLVLVLGEAELRPLQRVLDPQEHVARAHAAAPPVGERQHPPARLRGELGAAPGLHGAGARVRDRLLDAPLLGGHGAHRDGSGGEDGEAQQDAGGDQDGETGEAGPQATDSHDPQPPAIVSQRQRRGVWGDGAPHLEDAGDEPWALGGARPGRRMTKPGRLGMPIAGRPRDPPAARSMTEDAGAPALRRPGMTRPTDGCDRARTSAGLPTDTIGGVWRLGRRRAGSLRR